MLPTARPGGSPDPSPLGLSSLGFGFSAAAPQTECQEGPLSRSPPSTGPGSLRAVLKVECVSDLLELHLVLVTSHKWLVS